VMMSKIEVRSDKLAPPNGRFSQATKIVPEGLMVFISGMTARSRDGSITGIGDITAQTHQVCQNIQAAVEEAGGTIDDIVRVDCYTTDITKFKEIHQVREQYFKGIAPAS